MYLVLDGAAPAEERIEDLGLLIGRNSGSPIGDSNLDGRAILTRRPRRKNADPVTPLGSVFDGILDQVLEGVLHRQLVREHQRQVRLDLFFNNALGPGERGAARTQSFLDHSFDCDGLARPNRMSGPGARKTEDLLHQRLQLFGFVVNQGPVALHLLGPGGDLTAQIERRSADHRERCAQFVGYSSDEVHLQPGQTLRAPREADQRRNGSQDEKQNSERRRKILPARARHHRF